jgi:hypothetical protein
MGAGGWRDVSQQLESDQAERAVRETAGGPAKFPGGWLGGWEQVVSLYSQYILEMPLSWNKECLE